MLISLIFSDFIVRRAKLPSVKSAVSSLVVSVDRKHEIPVVLQKDLISNALLSNTFGSLIRLNISVSLICNNFAITVMTVLI